jgi:predicted house-cleaning noncanonical NTP pyrophosphatase (MazG superfamily)
MVRDFIPKIIEEDGSTCEWRNVENREEHTMFLRKKIIEEVDEFIEDPCLDEAADMLEVVRTFASINGIDFDDVVAAAHIKKWVRGSFARGVVLEKVNR